MMLYKSWGGNRTPVRIIIKYKRTESTVKRVNATAATTAITTTQPPKEYIVPNTIQY